MNLAKVESILNAVLYEGYLLYPYRPTSVKNRQRWTFGGLYPRAYSEAQGGTDPWSTQTECLLEARPGAAVDVKVRFLHLQSREVRTIHPPAPGPIGNQLLQSGQEAEEREVDLADLDLATLVRQPRHAAFSFPARRAVEPLVDAGGNRMGEIVRAQESVHGRVEVSAAHVADGLFRLTVRVENAASEEAAVSSQANPSSHPPSEAGLRSTDSTDSTNSTNSTFTRDQAQMRALLSTHTILAARDGSVRLAAGSARQMERACRRVPQRGLLAGVGRRRGRAGDDALVADHPV